MRKNAGFGVPHFKNIVFFGRSMPCTYYIKIGEELVQTENRTGLEA
jgi:hypothetical protein